MSSPRYWSDGLDVLSPDASCLPRNGSNASVVVVVGNYQASLSLLPFEETHTSDEDARMCRRKGKSRCRERQTSPGSPSLLFHVSDAREHSKAVTHRLCGRVRRRLLLLLLEQSRGLLLLDIMTITSSLPADVLRSPDRATLPVSRRLCLLPLPRNTRAVESLDKMSGRILLVRLEPVLLPSSEMPSYVILSYILCTTSITRSINFSQKPSTSSFYT